MARLLPSALLTRAAVVLGGLGYQIERETDPDAGPILIATDPDEGDIIVSVTDLGIVLSGTIGLRPALPQSTLDALVNTCSGVAQAARFSAVAPAAGESESVLFADALYAGAFEGKSFTRFVEGFDDDVYGAFEIADDARLLLHPSNYGAKEGDAPAPAPTPKTGTGRLARGTGRLARGT